jgi:hypothetical protein
MLLSSLPPQVFLTSLYSCCSPGTLYCCYFIIPLILLTIRRYVPYYHYLRNVVTSLSPVLFCTYVTIPSIALFLRCYVSCLTLVTSHLMLCFSSVPLFRSALSLCRYAYVSHCTIVCLHMTQCTICMSLYLVPRFDVLAAMLYSTSLNHVLHRSCVIISGTKLLLRRHIWLYSSHVVKHRIVQFLRPVTSYSIAVMP